MPYLPTCYPQAEARAASPLMNRKRGGRRERVRFISACAFALHRLKRRIYDMSARVWYGCTLGRCFLRGSTRVRPPALNSCILILPVHSKTVSAVRKAS